MIGSKHILFISLFLSFFLLPVFAWAYVGPGAGLSAIGTFFALLAAVFLAIVGFVWYPVKRMLKKRRNKNKDPELKS